MLVSKINTMAADALAPGITKFQIIISFFNVVQMLGKCHTLYKTNPIQ